MPSGLTLDYIKKNFREILGSGDRELVRRVAYKILIDGLNLLPSPGKKASLRSMYCSL